MKTTDSLLIKYKSHIFAFAAIFFLVFLTYANSVKFEFIGLDDTSIITNKTGEMDSVSKIKNFLTLPVFDEADSLFYRPALNFSFAADTIISGGEMGFYHFSNMMIHIAAVFALFLLLLSFNYSKTVSLLASLIFAVYPVLVSAVVWIPGRNDSLLAIFVFLTLIFFIKNVQTGKISYALISAVFLLFAAFTKETATIMPVVFLLYIFLYSKPDKKKVLAAIVISASVFLIYALLRSYTISQNSARLDVVAMTLNFLHSLDAYFWYCEVMFFLKRIYLYPNNISITAYDIIIGLIPFMIFAAAAYIFRKKINFKNMFFGLIWYFLFLAPTIVTKTGTYFNHRLYLPIIGILIIIIEITAAASLKIKKTLFVFCAITIVLFAFISHNHSFYYKDHSSFWINAYKQNPISYTAALETANYYEQTGDLENTEKYIFEALSLNKGNPNTRVLLKLGDFYFNKKEDGKALEYYAQAEKNNKYNEYIYLGLSKHYEMLRDKEKALSELERGLKLIPKSRLIAKRIKILKNELSDDTYVIVMKSS